jgi:hypothetical protein
MIVFLCPNGHKLNGPARLQGRAGECPHCGERFRIPLMDDEEEPSDQPHEDWADSSAGPRDQTYVDEQSLEEVDEFEEVVEEFAPEPVDDAEFGDEAEPDAAGGDEGVMDDAVADEVSFGSAAYRQEATPHPFKALFERLWSERAAGASVRIHLAPGGVYVPERYSPAMSRPSFGVFAARHEDHSYTLTALPWDAIQRIDVAGLPKLPEGAFGES